MQFDLTTTAIFQAVKRDRFFLFQLVKPLGYVFILLLFGSLYVVGLAILGFATLRMAAFCFLFSISGYLLCLNLQLFITHRVRNPKMLISLQDAVAQGEYNAAEFLSFSATQVMDAAIRFCNRRTIAVNTTALLYMAVKINFGIKMLSFRLGLDAAKLEVDLKNYLEKMQKGTFQEGQYAPDFLEAIGKAAEFSVKRGHAHIGEEELFAALAGIDPFFKQLLVQADLKKEDVEAITLWIDSVQEGQEERKKFWTYENLTRTGSMGKDWASGYTITLDGYSIDYRKMVSNWQVREVIGHKKEIEQAELILARSNLSNVLIVGEPGTGRKSIIEALAQKCYLGSSLPELNNKRVVELDMVRLASQVQDFEKLESTMDQIFQEAMSAGNVILVIDELQNFVSQSAQKAGTVDIAGVLAKYLAMPTFQFIGITSFGGLHKNIEQNSSFLELFQKVEVVEITREETIQVLQGSALEAEMRHRMVILYPTIREVVNLTDRYMPSLPFPKKALDILDEAIVYAQSQKQKVVLPSHIATIVSKKTEIPVGKMETKEKETLLHLEDLIHKRMVNQEEAIKEISSAMRRARAGITSKKRPMGTFLFLGPTGVGKTETAKALAQIYFGSEEKMIRIDMSEFQAIADIPRLLGAVSPVEVQGLLTTPVRETPFSLVLLDEIEKAHPNILNLFLQVLDEGHITDGQGRKVMFTNTIIICTSNGGADIIFKSVESGQAINKDTLLASLFEKNLFRPEFVNRFDATVIFHPLTRDNLLQIAELTLRGIQKGMKEKEINFEITQALKEKIVDLSYKPAYGAREMRRVVQNKVEEPIAEGLIMDKVKKGDTIEINPDTFELVVKEGIAV